jgi:Predicted nucleotide-binding protein containing TIR-like domain
MSVRSALIGRIKPFALELASPGGPDRRVTALIGRGTVRGMVGHLGTVFVGSSDESENLAVAVKKILERDSGVIAHYWRDVMEEHPGSTAIEVLANAIDKYDFGVFLLAADDVLSLRGDQSPSPRDNVIFEFGLFVGSLGRERTFALVPDEVEIRRPSDLGGVVLDTWKTTDDNPTSAVRASANKIRKKIELLGPRHAEESDVSGAIAAIEPGSPEESYDGWLAAVDAGALLPIDLSNVRPRMLVVHPTWGIGRILEVGPSEGASIYLTVHFHGRGTAQILSQGLFMARFRRDER